MENTLLTGDHVVVDKLGYPGPYNLLSRVLPARTVARGNIVVFEYPLDPSQSYVKRVIGVPGDRIRIAAKQLFVNGQALDELYKVHSASTFLSYRDNFPDAPPPGLRPRAHGMLRHARDGELVVPEGNYFVMGDNRDESDDSRYWGFVPRENIRGAPRLIYWSFDAPTPQLLAWFDFDHARNVVIHFHDRTRWERSPRLVRSYPLSVPGE